MARYLLFFVVAVLCSTPLSADSLLADSLKADQPNILFIYLDDFGWRDTGYMGSDFFETPHIDKLASGGMVFTDAYSGAANCAPARACLMSGQYSPRHQIFNVGTGPRGKSSTRRLAHVPGTDTLDTKIKTWAHQLQKAGYRTASMGKWHLSQDPIPYGFDLNVGGTHAGSPPNGYYPPHGKTPGLKNAPDNEYLTDTLAHNAVEFIRENRRRPWMLYLTHFAVHTPIQAKKELLQKYKDKAAGQLHQNARMATMIQAVDDGVAQLTRTLDELGLRQNTVIIFYSDNGGYGPATDMDPLKGYKGTYYEGGIRVPFFVNWPEVVQGGQKTGVPVTGVDLYPTLLEMAGAESPSDQPMDGVSLVPFLKGEVETLAPRSLYWHFPAYLQSYGSPVDEQRDPLFRSRPCSVVRSGDWKLHQFFEDDGIELYNLADDIGESRNLADKHPEKRDELLKDLQAWQRRISAPIPKTRNEEFDAESESNEIQRTLQRSRRKSRTR